MTSRDRRIYNKLARAGLIKKVPIPIEHPRLEEERRPPPPRNSNLQWRRCERCGEWTLARRCPAWLSAYWRVVCEGCWWPFRSVRDPRPNPIMQEKIQYHGWAPPDV